MGFISATALAQWVLSINEYEWVLLTWTTERVKGG